MQFTYFHSCRAEKERGKFFHPESLFCELIKSTSFVPEEEAQNTQNWLQASRSLWRQGWGQALPHQHRESSFSAGNFKIKVYQKSPGFTSQSTPNYHQHGNLNTFLHLSERQSEHTETARENPSISSPPRCLPEQRHLNRVQVSHKGVRDPCTWTINCYLWVQVSKETGLGSRARSQIQTLHHRMCQMLSQSLFQELYFQMVLIVSQLFFLGECKLLKIL